MLCVVLYERVTCGLQNTTKYKKVKNCKSDWKCDSLKQKTHDKLWFDLNRLSKSTTGARNMDFLYNIHVVSSSLSNTLFGLNHGYFERTWYIMILKVSCHNSLTW
jgi:hypothetical protein